MVIAGVRRRWRVLRVIGAALAALGLLSVAIFVDEAPVGAQESESTGVGISLDDLSSYPTHLTVDGFMVELTNLTATEEYQVTVSSDSARVGIGGCDTVTQTATVTGVEEREIRFVVYACAVGEATVTAEVRRAGASSPEASISQELMVEALPEIVIGPTGERIRTTTTTRGTRQAVPRAGTPGIVPNIEFFDRTATSVSVRWGQPSDGGTGTPLTGFGLKFWKEGTQEPGYDPEDVDVVGPPPTPSEYTYTGMERGATYNFRIHACNGVDSCGYWTHPPKQVGLPKKPHTISVDERKGTSARVRWSPEADTGGVDLTGFAIRWRIKDTSWPTQPQATPGQSARSHTMTGLIRDTTYEVSLQSCNARDSCSPWTDAHEFTSTDTTHEPGDNPPGPVSMLRITGVRNGTLDVAWQAPSDHGSTALTGYKLQYKQQSSATWGSSTNVGLATNPQHTISGLTNGTKYDVRVQACNANTSDPCGDWVSPVCGVPGTTTQPGQAVLGSGGVTATGTGGLRVSWDPPSCVSAITHYEVPHKEKTAASWPATGKKVITGTATTLLRLTVGTPYQVRVRACNSARTTTDKCGAWSATQDGTPSGAALPAPANLDVVPLASRQASLTWNRVTNATKYVVKVQVFGEASLFVPRCIDPGSGIVPQPPVGDNPKCAFKLDEITTKSGITVGLADEDAYQFHVIAEGSGFAPSRASETVSIIDTPIIAINGHTTNTGATDGEAAIQWKDVPTILADHSYNSGTYQFRYRRSSYSSHDSSWELDRYSSDMIEDVPAGVATSRSHTIDELFQRWVYAVQLIYTSNGRKVFSARDMYVWPSNTSMDTAPIATFERRSTIPTIPASDGAFEYSYRLCENSFPADDEDDLAYWVTFIEHAFGQWDHATNGLVRLVRETDANGDSLACSNRQLFLEKITENALDLLGKGYAEDEILAAVDGLLQSFRDSGIDVTIGGSRTNLKLNADLLSTDLEMNEVLMIRDKVWSKQNFIVSVFGYVSDDVWIPDCGNAGCTSFATYPDPDGDGTKMITTADIYLRESVHGNLIRVSDSDSGLVRFNKCPNTSDLYNYPYSSLLHEGGHALGFGGLGSHRGVPSVDESVMSYEKSVPSCAPHPLDIMIIYAIYQSES